MPANTTTVTPLAELLRERIRANGPITFAEYMDACLYHPQHGYYGRSETRRFADYYTSVDVHPIFGRLLARQLEEMWRIVNKPVRFEVVEAGASTGQLAKHILDFAEKALPEFYASTRYYVLERSPARRAAQQTILGTHIHTGVVKSITELPEQILQGCIFSNEALDAMPVAVVKRQRGKLQEEYVDYHEGRFVEVFCKPSTSACGEYLTVQQVRLREGQRAEIGLAAAEWIKRAGESLDRGFVMTIDYGHEAAQLYDERHNRGTLLAYQGHHVHEDFFMAPGACDLTAHVNFTALDLWGRRAGLARTGLVSQSHFLLALGRASEFADLYDRGESETERVRARLLLKNLIHPEGMGETFRVMVQHKGVTPPQLTGLQSI